MAKFRKLTILEQIGFIQNKFDGVQFKRSFTLCIRSYLSCIVFNSYLLKMSFSLFFDQKDVKQLYIGEWTPICPVNPVDLES